MCIAALVLLPVAVLLGAEPPPSHFVHHSLLERPGRALPASIVVLPPAIVVSEISAGGVMEQVEEWSKQARQNTIAALSRYLAAQGQFTPVMMPALTAEQESLLTEHLALFDVVAGNAFAFAGGGGGAWAHKRRQFDYTLGPGLAALKESTGADAALILIGADVVSTGGRKATAFLGAMLGMVVPLGRSFLAAGIVDLQTGDLLWLNSRVGVGATDLRKEADVEALLGQLFVAYPGLDAYREAGQ